MTTIIVDTILLPGQYTLTAVAPAPPPPPPPVFKHVYFSGHHTQSNQVDGTGALNNAEIALIAQAIAAGCPIAGHAFIYTWRNLEPTDNGYNFLNTVVADCNAFWAKCPTLPVSIMIWGCSFSGTTPQQRGTPDYILNTGMYGAGYVGAVNYGSWPFSYNPPTLCGGTAALWRSAVSDRYNALWQALAAQPTNRPGAPAGETFGTCPLFQCAFSGESSLSLASGSDYNDAGLIAAIEAWTSTVAESFPTAIPAPMLNYLNKQANVASLLTDVLAAGAARCGPDCYYSSNNNLSPHTDWFMAEFTGLQWSGTLNQWVAGGKDLRGQYVSIGSVQQETIAKYASFSTPQTSLNAINALGCQLAFWVILSGGAYDFASKLAPFLRANPLTNTARPAALT